MRADHLVHVLTTNIPRSIAWERHESYGPYRLKRKTDIKKVLYAVTPIKPGEEYFHQRKYDLLVSHHPYHALHTPQVILHTALDCCKGGLNDQWRDALQIKNPQHFDGTLGWHGPIDPIHFKHLCQKVENFTGYPILGQKRVTEDPIIKSAVVCSGLGGLVNDRALKTGAQCYIMGEHIQPAENTGFKSLIETGHTNSEWMGVKLIKSLLEPHGVQVDLMPHHLDRFGAEKYTPAVKYFHSR